MQRNGSHNNDSAAPAAAQNEPKIEAKIENVRPNRSEYKQNEKRDEAHTPQTLQR